MSLLPLFMVLSWEVVGSMAIAAPSVQPVDVQDVANESKSGFDSLNVRWIGAWSFGKTCRSVYVRGDTAFMSANGGIYILDISDPSNPLKIKEIGTRGFIRDMFFLNGYLFVADSIGGIEIWDIETPHRVSSFFTTGLPQPQGIMPMWLMEMADFKFISSARQMLMKALQIRKLSG